MLELVTEGYKRRLVMKTVMFKKIFNVFIKIK
jgi:hypothetical protein